MPGAGDEDPFRWRVLAARRPRCGRRLVGAVQALPDPRPSPPADQARRAKLVWPGASVGAEHVRVPGGGRGSRQRRSGAASGQPHGRIDRRRTLRGVNVASPRGVVATGGRSSPSTPTAVALGSAGARNVRPQVLAPPVGRRGLVIVRPPTAACSRSTPPAASAGCTSAPQPAAGAAQLRRRGSLARAGVRRLPAASLAVIRCQWRRDLGWAVARRAAPPNSNASPTSSVLRRWSGAKCARSPSGQARAWKATLERQRDPVARSPARPGIDVDARLALVTDDRDVGHVRRRHRRQRLEAGQRCRAAVSPSPDRRRLVVGDREAMSCCCRARPAPRPALRAGGTPIVADRSRAPGFRRPGRRRRPPRTKYAACTSPQ